MQTSNVSAFPGAWQRPAVERINAVSGPNEAGAGFGAVRQSVLRVIAAEVLGALTQADGGLRGAAARLPDAARAGPGAVAGALKSAIAQGADPQRLAAKVQDGIERAQSALAEQGVDPAQVASIAGQFTDRVARLMNAPAPDAEPVAVDALAASVQVSRKERGSLTLTTQDGDVLRIKFRSSERESVELASVRTQDAQVTSLQTASTARSRSSVEVEGTLDAGEMKAIEDFVAQVDALAAEFFEGDVESAFAAAASLGYDANEIAGFSLKLDVSERVRASVVQLGYGGADGTGTASPAQPVAQPANGTAPAADGSQAPATVPGGREPSVAAARQSPKDPLRTVQDFVQRVLGTADAPLSFGGVRLAWASKVALAAEIVSVAAPAAPEKPGGVLLADVLEGVARQAGVDARPPRLAAAA